MRGSASFSMTIMISPYTKKRIISLKLTALSTHQSTFPKTSHTANTNAKSPAVIPDKKALVAADVKRKQSSKSRFDQH